MLPVTLRLPSVHDLFSMFSITHGESYAGGRHRSGSQSFFFHASDHTAKTTTRAAASTTLNASFSVLLTTLTTQKDVDRLLPSQRPSFPCFRSHQSMVDSSNLGALSQQPLFHVSDHTKLLGRVFGRATTSFPCFRSTRRSSSGRPVPLFSCFRSHAQPRQTRLDIRLLSPCRRSHTPNRMRCRADISSRGGKIRTCDPLVPNQVR